MVAHPDRTIQIGVEMQLFLHVEHADAGADAQKVRDRWVATAFLGPHPLCASLFTPGLKGLLIPVALDAIALLILCDHSESELGQGHF